MYPLLLIEVVSLLVEAVLYGIYAITFSITLYLLLRSRANKTRSVTLIIVTVSMFCLSTAHLVLLASSLLRHIRAGLIDEALEFRDPHYPESYLQLLLECLNCILGDSIIAWRAWVLWNQRKFAIIVPGVLLSATLASAIGLCHAIVIAPAGQTTFKSHTVLLWGILAIGLTFVTNLWAVVLIAVRFWTHHRQVSALLGRENARPYRSILVFLVESGALYCGTLIVLAGMFAAHTNGLYIVLDMLAQFTGIYPTLIVILVCLQLTQRDTMDRFERATVPVSSSAGATQSRHHGVSFARMSVETTSNDSSYATEVQEHTGSQKKTVVAIE